MAIIDIADHHNVVRQLKIDFPNVIILFMEACVANRKELELAYRTILLKFGNVDVIVNAAGILDEHKIQPTIDINAVCSSL